ncbi:proteasome complex subunit Rpn13 ubiquitin receptor-domain-containing protein [Mrakia frigida]|uniref:proteasome regulatory particle lid subunit RPN13 n=1 Tax=Mrakia frigida TaxID=29902 RepID=UPI003FCC1EAB
MFSFLCPPSPLSPHPSFLSTSPTMPLTYKAGRAFRRGDTSFVDAEPEKGILSVQDGGDGLLHIFWKARNSPNYSLDLIVFPGDASFSHVKESNEDNVFVLNFESSEEKHFFWFQAADAPYALQAEHINATIEDPEFVAPPLTAAAATSLASTSTLPPATPAHQSVASSSTSAPPAAPNPRRTAGFNLSSADPETGYSAEQLAQLQAILEGQVASGPNAAAGESDIHLQDILTPKLLAPILSSSSLRASLFPHLPSDLPLSSATPSEPTEAELLAVIESAQFQEGVRSLDRALRTGLLGGLVQGLGLPEDAGLGVEQFLKAVGEQAEKKKREESGGGEMDTSE